MYLPRAFLCGLCGGETAQDSPDREDRCVDHVDGDNPAKGTALRAWFLSGAVCAVEKNGRSANNVWLETTRDIDNWVQLEKEGAE